MTIVDHQMNAAEIPRGSGGTTSYSGRIGNSPMPSRLSVVVVIVVWAFSAAYAWHYLDQGWFPHDEGALAHSAERVLQGELPHRDFDEIYTGGLSFANALAFRLFGTNLMSLRLVLFGVFLLWVPSVYYVATRFAGPVLAGLVTLLAVAWSIPNYSAAVPSWFNLFFAVFSLSAILRFLETQHRAWLIVSGITAGLSILAKITGVYVVAGALIALAFFEQTDEVHEDSPADRRYSVLLSLVAVLLITALVLLVQRSPGPSQFFHFVLPGSALAACMLWLEWREPARPLRARIRGLLFYIAPFLAGVAVPVVAFLIPYLVTSSIGDLVRGVFVLPARRFQDAAWPLLPLWTSVFVLPLAWLLFVLRVRSRGALFALLGVVATILGVALLESGRPVIAGMVWASMRPLIPLATFVGVYFLLRTRSLWYRYRQLMAVVAVTSMASLIQFPWSQPMYFIYVAPLAALALTVLVSIRPIARPFFFTVVMFYLLFAVAWLNSGHYSGADPHPRYLLTDRLDLERGGLRIVSEEARDYEELVDLVRQHASGRFVLALPDCPEVYFLTGLRNPTRWIFDFLKSDRTNTEMIMRTLGEFEVNAVVINEKPRFSRPLPADLRDALVRQYPVSARIGKFTVRWIP